MKRLTLICTVAALGGCTLPPLDEGPGPLEAGFAPAYQKTSNGTIVARACRQTAEPGFGNLPPRCATSLAYAAHAAHPHDLVHPRHAGPAISNPCRGRCEPVPLCR